MILPSDDNSTPRKKPEKRKPTPPASPSEPAAEPEMEEDFNSLFHDLGPLGHAATPEMIPEEWRKYLKSELVSSVEDLENFPDPEIGFDPPDPPDLYSFYSELIALREELAEREPAPSLQMPASVAVKLGLLAGEMKATGQEAFAERLLQIIEELTA